MSDLFRNPAIDPECLPATAINIDSLLAILEARMDGCPDEIGKRVRSAAEVCGEELILQAARQAAQFLWSELSELEKATRNSRRGKS